MTWEASEDSLVSDVGLLFFDCQTVRAVPSDYARAAIKLVRDFDSAKQELERRLQDDSGLPTRVEKS